MATKPMTRPALRNFMRLPLLGVMSGPAPEDFLSGILPFKSWSASPDMERLEVRVHARISDKSRAATRPAPADVDAHARIERVPRGLRGSIDLRGPDGSVQREVNGDDCSEIV